MTDRELLEFAAKAAGGIATDGLGKCWNMEREAEWNPITDDGDFFRLLAGLWLHYTLFMPLKDGAFQGFVEIWREDDEDPLHVEYFSKGEERFAAIKRAGVRAAAEIGKGMK